MMDQENGGKTGGGKEGRVCELEDPGSWLIGVTVLENELES